jgi:hypothetical protein
VFEEVGMADGLEVLDELTVEVEIEVVLAVGVELTLVVVVELTLVVVVEVEVPLVDVVAVPFTEYTDSRQLAPHMTAASPAQAMLQSVSGSSVLSEFPQ